MKDDSECFAVFLFSFTATVPKIQAFAFLGIPIFIVVRLLALSQAIQFTMKKVFWCPLFPRVASSRVFGIDKFEIAVLILFLYCSPRSSRG